LFFWFLAKTGTALQRGFVRFMPQYLDRLPIVSLTGECAKTLERIGSKATKTGKASVRDEIDDYVSGLYERTDEESALTRNTREIRQ
jgi:hypothetical protein